MRIHMKVARQRERCCRRLQPNVQVRLRKHFSLDTIERGPECGPSVECNMFMCAQWMQLAPKCSTLMSCSTIKG